MSFHRRIEKMLVGKLHSENLIYGKLKTIPMPKYEPENKPRLW